MAGSITDLYKNYYNATPQQRGTMSIPWQNFGPASNAGAQAGISSAAQEQAAAMARYPFAHLPTMLSGSHQLTDPYGNPLPSGGGGGSMHPNRQVVSQPAFQGGPQQMAPPAMPRPPMTADPGMMPPQGQGMPPQQMPPQGPPMMPPGLMNHPGFMQMHPGIMHWMQQAAMMGHPAFQGGPVQAQPNVAVNPPMFQTNQLYGGQ